MITKYRGHTASDGSVKVITKHHPSDATYQGESNMELTNSCGLGGFWTQEKQKIFDDFVDRYNVKKCMLDNTSFSFKVKTCLASKYLDCGFIDHERLVYTKDHRTLLVTQPYLVQCYGLKQIRDALRHGGYGIDEINSWYYPTESRAFVIYKSS